MKKLMKKIDMFMLKSGGYALLVATVATGVFFAVLQWANDYVEERTQPLELMLDEDGYLSVDYQYDDKENVYILWETDAGNIKAENKTDIFKQQEEQEENNKGYFSYSLSSEKARWYPEDADGYRYDTATVRAVLYEADEKNIYKLENYVMELTITLHYENGEIKKVKDRLFSNPVRENSDEHWSQIYCIGENENEYIYRYRTGEKIDKDETQILCWMADKKALSEVNYAKGYFPDYIKQKDKTDEDILKASTIISCKKGEGDVQIYAGLVDEEGYKKKVVEKKDIRFSTELTAY